jgi:hypothetical protein
VLDDYYYLGAYWKVRTLTLREYANQIKDFLIRLQTFHPIFTNLYLVGNNPNSDLKLTSDFSNLDSLIYKFSWDRNEKYEKANSDGSPSWESTHDSGYRMIFNNGKSFQNGGVTISISAGMYLPMLSNAIIMKYPVNYSGFPIDFSSYESNEQLFKLTVNFWRPEAALFSTGNFSDKVSYEYGSNEYLASWEIGWLTYLDNLEVVTALPSGIEYQLLEAGGTMIITSKETISPENSEHVAKAIRIRESLASQGLLKQRQYS